MITVDNFIDDYPALRRHCDGLAYEGITSPVDGVFYPGVDLSIQAPVAEEVIEKLVKQFNRPVHLKSLFFRMSYQGKVGPHQAHTDAVMGQHSLMVYLSREEHCQGGTAFLEHKETGLKSTPINQEELDLLENDMNKKDQWKVSELCKMAPNRACIFHAGLMHRAEPVGGFGTHPVNGRLVLTGFFDVN